MQNKQATESTNIMMICQNHNAQRLDNFLFYKLKQLSKSQVYKFIRTGQVRVNGGRIKSSYKLQLGDKVRIPPFIDLDSPAPTVNHKFKHILSERILYEDKDLLIINKPSGLAVHGGSGISSGLIETLRAMRPDERFLELVHRLDRETSGCILVAKSRTMLVRCHQLLREGLISKSYLTLVAGDWRGPKQVSMPLKKNQLKSGERIVKVDPEGKEALTLFKKIKSLPGATLLEASPVTGRTHQIRVHTAFMNHPILGDQKYGRASDNRAFAQLGLKRLFLHAHKLVIPREDNPPLTIEAPLDTELDTFLTNQQ